MDQLAMIYVVGLLVTGAASAMLRKVLFQLEAPGEDGDVHKFVKPWFTTFDSAWACMLCLVIYQLFRRVQITIVRQRRVAMGHAPSSIDANDADGLNSPLLERAASGGMSFTETQKLRETVLPKGETPFHKTMKVDSWLAGDYGNIDFKKVVKLIFPATTLNLALGTQGMGLRYTTASVSQMISGSCIIFTAVLAIIFLKRSLNTLHWAGITLCTIGITIVSLASFMVVNGDAHGAGRHAEKYTTAETIYGVTLTLLSQLIQAVQLIAEEANLQDLRLHPLQVVGLEGCINIVLMVVISLPLVYLVPGPDYGGREENSFDTWQMLASPAIQWWNQAYFWNVLFTNLFGVLVTSTLGSVFRAVLLTARTALVWAAGLVLFYSGVGGGKLGEDWNSSSPVEAVGFALLLAGTVVYAQGSSKVAATARRVQRTLERRLIRVSTSRAVTVAGLPPGVPVDEHPELPSLPATALGTSAPAAIPSALKLPTRRATTDGVNQDGSPAGASPVGNMINQVFTLAGISPPAPAGALSASLVVGRQQAAIPMDVRKEVAGEVVAAVSARQAWSAKLKADMEAELASRLAAGSSHRPTIGNTLLASTSWVVPDEDIDRTQHVGASAYVNPLTQLPPPKTTPGPMSADTSMASVLQPGAGSSDKDDLQVPYSILEEYDSADPDSHRFSEERILPQDRLEAGTSGSHALPDIADTDTTDTNDIIPINCPESGDDVGGIFRLETTPRAGAKPEHGFD